MAFMAPSRRPEDVGEDGSVKIVKHDVQFTPPGAGGKGPHFLATTEPISRRYLEAVDRIFDKMDLRTRQYVKVKAPTTIKFELMDAEDIDFVVKQTTRFMTLRECDLQKGDKEGPILQTKSGMYEIVQGSAEKALKEA